MRTILVMWIFLPTITYKPRIQGSRCRDLNSLDKHKCLSLDTSEPASSKKATAVAALLADAAEAHQAKREEDDGKNYEQPRNYVLDNAHLHDKDSFTSVT
jgi:hypothetical protein